MSVNHYERTISTHVRDDRREAWVTPEFERSSGDYTIVTHSSMSDEGMRQHRALAALFEQMCPTFDALADRLGTCEHGYEIRDLIEDGVLSWSVNDYCCDPYAGDENVFWMLYGMHDEDGEWCFARSYFRGVVCDYYDSDWFTVLLDLGSTSNVIEGLVRP
jgi:hypothetical protein